MVTEINLLPKRNRIKSNIFVLSIVLGAILVIFFIFLLLQYINTKSELETITAMDSQLLSTKTEMESSLNNLQGVNKDSFSASVDFVESVSYPVSPLIDELESYLVGNSYLTSYSFSESSLSISADFETLTEVATYVEHLSKSTYFADVQVNAVSKFNVESGDTEENLDEDFTVIPRHSVQFDLLINDAYLGGRP